jgi:hypothetical protein
MAGIKNTPFTPDSDIVAQITGTGQPTPGYNGAATVGSGFAPVYAASIELAPFLQKSRFVLITTTAGVGNASLTAAFVAPAGARLAVQIANDAGGARTITFSTGFRATGTVVGTASKIILVDFVSDGTTWNEVARSVSAIT